MLTLMFKDLRRDLLMIAGFIAFSVIITATIYVLPIIEQFNIRNLDAFEKFVLLILLNNGKLLNRHRIAREAGVSQTTEYFSKENNR